MGLGAFRSGSLSGETGLLRGSAVEGFESAGFGSGLGWVTAGLGSAATGVGCVAAGLVSLAAGLG